MTNTLDTLIDKLGNPSRYTNHETDDHGYPLCDCAPCVALNARMNERYFQNVLAGVADPDRMRPATISSADNDYDGDMGREHSEYMRDNGQRSLPLSGGGFTPPAWHRIGDVLPTIESPSIAADMPETANEKVERDGTA